MSAQQEIKDLKQEVARLKNLMADHAENAASNGMSKMIFTKDEICELANNAGKEVREYLGSKQEQLTNARENCKETIKERPFTSAAIAFAGGAVIGMLLRGRR